MGGKTQRLLATAAGICSTLGPALTGYAALVQVDDLSYPTRPLPKSDPRARLNPRLLGVQPAPVPTFQGRKSSTSSRTIEFDLETKKSTVGSFIKAPRVSSPEMTQPGSLGSDPTGVEKEPAVPESRTIFGRDSRILVRNTTRYPWRTTAKVYMTFPNRQVFVCSGILISRQYLLTAGHCIHNAAAGGWARRVEVIPGLNGTYKPYGSVFATYFRSYVGWTKSQDSNYDMALVTLDRPIGSTTGWLGYAYLPRINRSRAVTAGYPASRGRGLRLYSASGRILSSTAQLVGFRMDATGGQSGSGLYRTIRSNPYVFGILAFGSTAYNGGTRIDRAKFDDIQGWIASGR
jgi:glutamyl endopeptidase